MFFLIFMCLDLAAPWVWGFVCQIWGVGSFVFGGWYYALCVCAVFNFSVCVYLFF